MLASRHILSGEAFVTILAFAISQIAVGMFCYSASHILWGRFDFVSELIWVDISGSYESANVNLGNQLSGHMQTSKSVINIESMTMRVWVSEIDTVIFGKDEVRQLTGMRGLQSTADDLAAALKAFGETRSMVVAPTSSQDLARAKQVGAMSQMLGGVQADAKSTVLTAALNAIAAPASSAPPATPVTSATPAEKQRFCAHCGAAATHEARFCGKCGQALSA